MLRDSILFSLWKRWIICIVQACATEIYRQHTSCLTLNLTWNLLVLDFLRQPKTHTARDHRSPNRTTIDTFPLKSTLVNLTLANPWIYSPLRLFYFVCCLSNCLSITLILSKVFTSIWQPAVPNYSGSITTLQFTRMSSRTCSPKWLCLIQHIALI